jgi:xylulokinase
MIFLGIDSGTQSTKCIAIELGSAKILGSGQSAYSMIEGLPVGFKEQHPVDWIRAVEESISLCVQQLGERVKEVAGIGVSGQQHGLVVLDQAGNVIRPAKLWCDTSTQGQCEQLAHEFGGQPGLIAKAGNAILPGYTIPKLLWMKQNEPELFDKIKTVLLPHDYINYILTGQVRMEYGDASGTGVLKVQEREWSHELMDAVDSRVKEMFPKLGCSKEACGVLLPEVAQRLGLPTGVVVSAGGGDNMMGAIGTGNIKEGIITASFGTSGTLYGVSESPVIDGQGEVAAFCDSTEYWMPLVCTMNVTVITEKVRHMYGWSLSELEQQVGSAPAGAEGLIFLPYLNGERTPSLPQGKGVLYGLTMDNMRPSHVARAAVEGATLGLAYGLKRFRDLGMNPKEIRLTGGGSKSSVWRQIIANIFNAEVVNLETSEGAALGGAIQAAFTVLKDQGKAKTYEALCADWVVLDESSRCKPQSSEVKIYQLMFDRFVELTRDLNQKGWI